MLCRRCGEELERTFRFCPWCAEPQRRKIVEFFLPHADIEAEGRVLRVSRYLGSRDDERHVRFSVWNESGRAESAISVSEDEADRLARFLLEPPACGSRHPTVDAVLRHLRAATRRIAASPSHERR